MKTEYILGIPVDVLTVTSIMNELPSLLDKSQKITYTSINPQIATHAKEYPEIVEFIEESTHRIPDGIGIVKVSQMQGGAIKERVTGIELMYQLLEYANRTSDSIFLYGAKPDVVEKAAENINKQYPQVKIAGYLDGYTDLTDQEIVATINQVKPTYLFVALGFPKQEQWLAKNYKNVEAKVFQDVGGSFDVISGQVKRAPSIFIKFNMEWLYRSLSNPKRLYRIFELPVFLYRARCWYRKNQK